MRKQDQGCEHETLAPTKWDGSHHSQQSEGICLECFMMLLVSLTLTEAAWLGSSGSLGIQQPGAPHLHQELAEGLMAGI